MDECFSFLEYPFSFSLKYDSKNIYYTEENYHLTELTVLLQLNYDIYVLVLVGSI